jgi:hypothetical protein
MLNIKNDESIFVMIKVSQRDTCIVEDNQALSSQQSFVASEDENLKLFQVQMSSHYLGKNADKKMHIQPSNPRFFYPHFCLNND